MAFKFVLPVLAVAGTAFAECSVSGTTTVSNLDDIKTCSTFTGNIAVATGVTNEGTADFKEIKKIDGDFVYKSDDQVKTIKLPKLEEVTGNFGLSNLSSLSTSGLGSLKTIGGDLVIEGVALSRLGLDAGLEEVQKVRIVNTGINSLDGIANVSKIEGLTISDNLQLGEIGLSVSEIGNINIGSGQTANGGQAAKFPNLESVEEIVIRNCSSIDLSSLSEVSGDLRLLGNTVASFSVKNLTEVGGIVIQDNNKMKNLSFPELKRINSTDGSTLWIANNTQLSSISGFPKLEYVGGDATFKGNFTKLDIDGVERIRGALKVDTTSTSFDCDEVDEKLGEVVDGSHGCRKGEDANLKGSPNDDDDSDNSSSSSDDDDDSAAASLQIPATLLSGVALVASFMSMFM